MKVPDRNKILDDKPQLIGSTGSFSATLALVTQTDDLEIYELNLTSPVPAALPKLKVQWRIPANNLKGEWTTGALYEKRLRADWEMPSVRSRVSVNAPVISLFAHDDYNLITIACSDVINLVELEAPIREENSFVYCCLRFFTEKMPHTQAYKAKIRIDRRPVPFFKALNDVSNWWASFTELKPIATPEAASWPVYSTWYSYHQNFTTEALLEECRLSAKLGYKTIIVDDGWQTMDGNRGYDFTGDWEAERIADPKIFVEQVHELGMKVMFWYSVPFCGKKSSAYQQFKGKFLTEKHPWAPIFDPRYPGVRAYLIEKYTNALKDWDLDGFKLDFIDEFKTYPETELTLDRGRDYASVNAAVDRLLTDAINALKAQNPGVLIEFRQKYIGPAMRKYGNMFRAFDCPNDAATNRLRTTDVKLLCGSTVVHADMICWNYEEAVEIAAFQFVNILFSVPQLSVRLAEIPEDHSKMIQFYTQYWEENHLILLNGKFEAYSPSSNYPVLSAAAADKIIFGIYEHQLVELDGNFQKIDLINGKMSEQLVFECLENLGVCSVQIFDCMGNLEWESRELFEEGVHALEVPVCGMICIEKI